MQMNRLTVVGRLVRDTEMKQVGDGQFVLNNTLAIARPFKTESGQDTDFLNFVAWGKRAELIEMYCSKGELVGLDGRIQSRTYENDKQQTVYITEMLVENVYFLQPRRKKSQRQSNESTPKPSPQNTSSDNQGTDQEEVSKDAISLKEIITANS